MILDLSKIPKGVYFTFVRSEGMFKPVVMWAFSSSCEKMHCPAEPVLTQAQLDEALDSISKAEARLLVIKTEKDTELPGGTQNGSPDA